MRLWISALVFVMAGVLMVWLGAKQFGDAWPRNIRSLDAHVADVDTRVVPAAFGREALFGIRVNGLGARFEVVSALLPRPTAAALMDANSVTIEYDDRVRLRANPAFGTAEPYYVVTGLTADGRVQFSSSAFRAVTVAWALLFAIPGLVLVGLGATWLYRLFRFGHIYRLRGRLLFSPIASRGRLTSAGASSRRKTADGQWLH